MQPALAFFPEPDPLTLDIGGAGVVNVNGPPGEKGAINITSIIILPVGVAEAVPGKRTGSGTVPVRFLGLGPGSTQVTFLGTYKGQQVSGGTTIEVRDPLGTSAQIPQFASAGDPINTSNGEYYGSEGVDLNLGGPMPLMFSRYVASGLADDGVADGNLGQNRLHNFASRMTELGDDGKDVILPNGRRVTFRKEGGKWVLSGPLDIPYILVESGANFLLGHPHTQAIWTYDSAGRLTKIEDGKGNVHTLTYNLGGQFTGVADGLGRSLALTYTSGRIATVTGQPGGRVVTFTYTGNVLTSATDQGGHTTLYGNNGGLPTSVTRPEGNVLFTQIYTDGKVTSQTERGADTGTLDYAGETTTYTDPTGETLVDQYDGGRLVSHADEAGKEITMTHDAAGRRNSITDRLGDKTTIVYHEASGLPAVITNAEGRNTTMTYKARALNGMVFHDLVKVTYPDGSSRSFTYDGKGNLIKATDQAGKSWSFTYNARGQVLTATNPLTGASVYTYDDATGNLATSRDPDMVETTYLYDGRNRLTQIGQAGGANVGITYDAKDRAETITDERGNTYTYAYDTNDRVTAVTDPDSQTTSYAHDVLDRVNEVTDRLGKLSSVTYNSRRLIASATDGNANESTFDYDSRQRLTGITNPGGQQWTIQHDDEGLPVAFGNPIDAPHTLKRNHLGQTVEMRDPLGNNTLLTRDAMQRVTRVFDPMGRQTLYSYDKRGLLISATEQGTGTAKYLRDSLGALSKLTDPAGGSWSFAYTKGGRLTTITDPLGKKTNHAYDNRGRIQTSTLPDGATVTRSYDAASNLTGVSHSDGPVLAFTYDDLNRLASTNGIEFAYDAEGRVINTKQNGFDFGATYDDGGRLVTVSYLDGAVTVTYVYDSRDRLTQVTDNQTTAQIDFTYDDADRLTGLTRSNGVNGAYTYDGAGRLIRIEEGGIIDLQYTLNAAGEVTSVDYDAPLIPAPPAAAQLLKFDKASRIITTGYVYDLRGRLTASPGGQIYAWDGASRLVSADGVALEYDGLGGLTRRVAGAEATRFYHHHAFEVAPIVAEAPEGAGSTRAYVWSPDGDLLYAFDMTTQEVSFYHFDRTGSTLALTDSTGTVTDSYAYGPYGESMTQSHNGTSTQPFTYVGEMGVRAEGSLYQMGARYYDPATARFLSRDPVWPSITAPKRLNPYEYAAESPGEFVDPSGTEEGRLRVKPKKRRRARRPPVLVPPTSCTLAKPSGAGSSTASGFFSEIPIIGSGFPFSPGVAPDWDACSSLGSTNTCYKIGGTWAPVRDIRFRGNYARSIRAPSIQDLFAPSPMVNFPEDGAFKVGESTSPVPADRIFFSYDYFDSGPLAGDPFSSAPFRGGVRVPVADVFGNTVTSTPGESDIVSGTISSGSVSSDSGPPASQPINPNSGLPKGINPAAAYFAGFGDTPPPR